MGKTEKMKQISLGDLAEICLGKVILKDDIVTDGNARVAGISNLTEQGLIYEDMEMTNVKEEDMVKHEIRDNDVLITCRGTKFRSLLVENKPPYLVIASGNLMILRCKKTIDAEVIHLYLQSPMGEAEIMKQYQGKNSISIGKKQLLSTEIPMLSEKGKEEMVQLWKQGMKKYINTISEAEKDWSGTVDQINRCFVGFDEADQPTPMKKSKGMAGNKPQDRLLIELD